MAKLNKEMRAEICRLYESGQTTYALGEMFGVAAQTICNTIKRAGIKPRNPADYSPLTRHADEMRRLYSTGLSTREIAERFNCAAQTVANILGRLGVELRFRARPKEVIEQERAERAQATEARYLEIYGCSRAEVLALRQGDNARKYVAQRFRALQRGIPWKFTFPSWWALWQRSGKWNERGVGKYVMARFGDTGPYSPDNVEIVTQAKNIRDAHRNHQARGLQLTPGRPRLTKNTNNILDREVNQ